MEVPLAVPNLSGREGEYLQSCVDSTFVSTAGPFVDAFAEQIAAVSGTDSAVLTCSGTVALQMALEGWGIGAGDLVIAPALTFIATPNAISHSGAQPWLFDVDPGSWTLDIDLVASELRRNTETAGAGRVHTKTGAKVRAIMPVMTMGASVDLVRIADLASDFGLRVIVDAAAAIGATDFHDHRLGASGADAICYSFNGNKTITSGGGGAIAAADGELVERVSHLVSTGRIGPGYEHDVVAYNFRMTNIEAAVGLAQIEQLDAFLERKEFVARTYDALASRHKVLQPFPTPNRGRSVHWFSGVAYGGPNPDLPLDFSKRMRDAGIDVRPFWKPIHQQAPYEKALRTSMEVTDGLWWRIVPLPCSTGITDEELAHVVNTADEFWAAHD